MFVKIGRLRNSLVRDRDDPWFSNIPNLLAKETLHNKPCLHPWTETMQLRLGKFRVAECGSVAACSSWHGLIFDRVFSHDVTECGQCCQWLSISCAFIMHSSHQQISIGTGFLCSHRDHWNICSCDLQTAARCIQRNLCSFLLDAGAGKSSLHAQIQSDHYISRC